MRLCDDKEMFKTLLERASREYKILEVYVEKIVTKQIANFLKTNSI